MTTNTLRDTIYHIVWKSILGQTATSGASTAADAIIAALPGMVEPLIWERNGSRWAGGHGNVIRKMGSEYTLTVRNSNGRQFESLEQAKATAERGHIIRSMYALGVTV